jgi:pimeloyl-ACP methyl ester carboxylesterase
MIGMNRQKLMDTSPRIEITPGQALADEAVHIRLAGFPAHQSVTIKASLQDDQRRVWNSQASFETDEQGAVDLSSASPLSGSYTEADPMGLFWSMNLDENTPERSMFAKAGVSPLAVSFVSEINAESVATLRHERVFLSPGVRQQPVNEAGLAGTFFTPSEPGPHPGILVLTGSGGGLLWADQTAALLASRGYAALALAYFAYQQLPPTCTEIPLEYFETALSWMQAQESVLPDRLAVMGISLGGELALLLGATFKKIKAVIAYVPSHVIFGNFEAEEKSPWSCCRKPLEFMKRKSEPDPVAAALPGEPIQLTPWFLANYNFDDPTAAGEAAIPVERSNGPILLISGQDDQMWPSAMMAGKVIERLARCNFPFSATHLSYPGAGHYLSFPFLPVTIQYLPHPIVKTVFAFGGFPKEHCQAQADSWLNVIRFLEKNLGARGDRGEGTG